MKLVLASKAAKKLALSGRQVVENLPLLKSY